MNAYLYDQLTVGWEERFQRTITEEMMVQFRSVSGDDNPLHCNDSFARALGFPGRVVYGMLTASLYSALAGVYLPGLHCLLYGTEISYSKPVFIGDQLTVTGKVAEKNDTFRMIVVKASIVNQQGEKVSKATLTLGFTGVPE